MEAEKRAQDLHSDAAARQAGLSDSIEQKKAELLEKYTKESDKLIAEAEVNEKEKADAEIAALDAELQAKEASLAAAFDKNRSEWTKRLFDIVVGA
jgi:hypothetical protein